MHETCPFVLSARLLDYPTTCYTMRIDVTTAVNITSRFDPERSVPAVWVGPDPGAVLPLFPTIDPELFSAPCPMPPVLMKELKMARLRAG